MRTMLVCVCARVRVWQDMQTNRDVMRGCAGAEGGDAFAIQPLIFDAKRARAFMMVEGLTVDQTAPVRDIELIPSGTAQEV